MECYELTLLFSIRDDAYNTGVEAVREILKKVGGQLSKEEDMGEKMLAYPVRKETHGHYLFWLVELEGSAIASFKEALQANESVLKFLLIKKL